MTYYHDYLKTKTNKKKRHWKLVLLLLKLIIMMGFLYVVIGTMTLMLDLEGGSSSTTDTATDYNTAILSSNQHNNISHHHAVDVRRLLFPTTFLSSLVWTTTTTTKKNRPFLTTSKTTTTTTSSEVASTSTTTSSSHQRSNATTAIGSMDGSNVVVLQQQQQRGGSVTRQTSSLQSSSLSSQPQPQPPKIIVVGFPKAGTSSIFDFFHCNSNKKLNHKYDDKDDNYHKYYKYYYKSQHWYCCEPQTINASYTPHFMLMSQCILRNLATNYNRKNYQSRHHILEDCGEYDVYTEINGPRNVVVVADNDVQSDNDKFDGEDNDESDSTEDDDYYASRDFGDATTSTATRGGTSTNTLDEILFQNILHSQKNHPLKRLYNNNKKKKKKRTRKQNVVVVLDDGTNVTVPPLPYFLTTMKNSNSNQEDNHNNDNLLLLNYYKSQPRLIVPQHHYLNMISEQYPNAIFVLNTRPVKDWVHSVINWNTQLKYQLFNEFYFQYLKSLLITIPATPTTTSNNNTSSSTSSSAWTYQYTSDTLRAQLIESMEKISGSNKSGTTKGGKSKTSNSVQMLPKKYQMIKEFPNFLTILFEYHNDFIRNFVKKHLSRHTLIEIDISRNDTGYILANELSSIDDYYYYSGLNPTCWGHVNQREKINKKKKKKEEV